MNTFPKHAPTGRAAQLDAAITWTILVVAGSGMVAFIVSTAIEVFR